MPAHSYPLRALLFMQIFGIVNRRSSPRSLHLKHLKTSRRRKKTQYPSRIRIADVRKVWGLLAQPGGESTMAYYKFTPWSLWTRQNQLAKATSTFCTASLCFHHTLIHAAYHSSSFLVLSLHPYPLSKTCK